MASHGTQLGNSDAKQEVRPDSITPKEVLKDLGEKLKTAAKEGDNGLAAAKQILEDPRFARVIIPKLSQERTQSELTTLREGTRNNRMRSSYLQQALETAIHQKSIPMMQLLCDHGAHPNSNLYGVLPLPTACGRLWVEGVHWLLKHGAKAETSARIEDRFWATLGFSHRYSSRGYKIEEFPALVQKIDAAIKIYGLLFAHGGKLPFDIDVRQTLFDEVTIGLDVQDAIGLQLKIQMQHFGAAYKSGKNFDNAVPPNSDVLKTSVVLMFSGDRYGVVEGPLGNLGQLVQDAVKVKAAQRAETQRSSTTQRVEAKQDTPGNLSPDIKSSMAAMAILLDFAANVLSVDPRANSVSSSASSNTDAFHPSPVPSFGLDHQQPRALTSDAAYSSTPENTANSRQQQQQCIIS